MSDAPAAKTSALVLIDEHSQYGPLGEPSWEVTVWELTGSATDLEPPAGPFSAILVDRSSLDLAWLDRVLRAVVASLAPGGRILIRLDPEGGAMPGSPRFDGLAWGGVEMVAGRVCAVLRTGPSDSPIADLLAATHSAVRLASAAAGRDLRAALDQAERALAHQIEERSRSEHGLLDHLERLSSQAGAPRRRSRVRARLRRYRVTRAAPALLRRLRRIRTSGPRSAGS